MLLTAEKGSLVISATNLDIGITITLPVKVIEEGVVAVPGAIFTQTINSVFNDKNITLETEEGNIKVVTEHSKTTIKCLLHDDFPTIPTVFSEKVFSIPADDFKKGLRSVVYAASLSTIKPTLSSVCIYGEDETLTFVSTDSFRLAEKKIHLKKEIEVNHILLPFKNIQDIIRVFDTVSGSIEIHPTEHQIAFMYEGVYMVSRLVDGSFPAYTNLIPKESSTEVTLLKQDLLNTLKQSNIFTDKFSQIFFTVSVKNKTCEIRTKNADIGETSATLDVVAKGEDISISFNYKYIIDCFSSIESDSISLLFNGTSKPMIIRGVHDTTFTYLVMPMNK
jgi:DNA polymerase-3 subunit beta